MTVADRAAGVPADVGGTTPNDAARQDSSLGDTELGAARRSLSQQLLALRSAADHWDGRLSSSALSTGTAVLALHLADTRGYQGPVPRTPGGGNAAADGPHALAALVAAGSRWLCAHQNADGGWGDTDRSKSNISTTAIVWAALSLVESSAPASDRHQAIVRANRWLEHAAGATTPAALRGAILRRYGKDQTFSVPILTVLALSGKLGADDVSAWRSVPQLPFELAALPHTWFHRLQLPVVSYALPALIAIGQVRHRRAPSRNLALRALRTRVAARTHRLLRAMQPETGGYLEATPLTAFVVMSLAGMGAVDSPVVEHGIRFLVDSAREDGSWPIDTHLATWGTTLSVTALSEAGELPPADVPALRQWILAQQTTAEHPFTHAAPGGWAWTPLSGGVPDADDTSGALVALAHLGRHDPAATRAAAAGATWLLDLQNRDGGMPTFCRGWGALPFDRSTPEITAHALVGWSAWYEDVDPSMQGRIASSSRAAIAYLLRCQRADGSWVPLWFGNEHVDGETNPVYGTARVLLGLCAYLARLTPKADAGLATVTAARERGLAYLLQAQNADGGWGGASAVESTIEETGVVLHALRTVQRDGMTKERSAAVTRGTRWLLDALPSERLQPAPIGLYFANLWYYEALYPYIFGLAGLGQS